MTYNPPLAKMPEPYAEQVTQYSGIALNKTERFFLYTADQLRAAMLAERAAERQRIISLQADGLAALIRADERAATVERCAKICEAISDRYGMDAYFAFRSAAQAIRQQLTQPADAASARQQAPSLVCPYCKQPDLAWLPSDLLRGKRGTPTGVEYHCQTAKVMD